MTREEHRSTAGPVARRYVQGTAAVAVLGSAWCVAFLTVGAGSEALAYVFVPAGGVLATASVHRLASGAGLDPVARRFWRAVELAVGLITIGYSWLAADMFTTHSWYVPADATFTVYLNH